MWKTVNPASVKIFSATVISSCRTAFCRFQKGNPTIWMDLIFALSVTLNRRTHILVDNVNTAALHALSQSCQGYFLCCTVCYWTFKTEMLIVIAARLSQSSHLLSTTLSDTAKCVLPQLVQPTRPLFTVSIKNVQANMTLHSAFTNFSNLKWWAGLAVDYKYVS